MVEYIIQLESPKDGYLEQLTKAGGFDSMDELFSVALALVEIALEDPESKELLQKYQEVKRGPGCHS